MCNVFLWYQTKILQIRRKGRKNKRKMVKQCLMYSVHLVHLFPIQFSLVLYGSTQSTSVHSVHFGLIPSPLVLFGPLWSNSVHSVYYFPIWSYSVLVDPIRSILFTLVLYGLFGLSQSTSILFSPLSSTSDLFYLLCSIQSIQSN